MSPQIPNIASVASAVVLLLGMIGVHVVAGDLQKILEAILVVTLAGVSVYGWFRERFLSKKIAQMSVDLARANMAITVAKEAKKK